MKIFKGDFGMGKIMGIVGLLFVGVVIVFGSFSIVGPGTMGILVIAGKASPVALAPGIHFKLPIVGEIIPMSVRVNKLSVAEQAMSANSQAVHTKLAVNFHIESRDVSWEYTHVGTEQRMTEALLAPKLNSVFKAVVAKYKAEDLIANWDQVRGGIQKDLSAVMAPYMVAIDGVSITSFAFSPEYQRSIEEKQVALQQAKQKNYELSGAKIEAEKTIVTAQAEAKAMQLKESVLTKEIVQLEAIKKWNGKLPTVMGNAGVPMIGLGDIPSLKRH